METSYLKPNIQLFAEGEGVSSAATSATASATASQTAAGAENGTQAATQQTTATGTQETKPFKSFASEAEYQKELDFKVQQALKTHEEKLKGKLTPEIRKQLEAEANMTAEQKVQARLDELEAGKKALAKEKNRIKAESLLVKGGITDEVSRAAMLDSVVGEDEAESLKRTQALVDAIEKATNEKIKAAMKQVTPPDGGDGKDKEKDKAVEYAKSLATKRAAAAKASSSAIDYYINGGKKA